MKPPFCIKLWNDFTLQARESWSGGCIFLDIDHPRKGYEKVGSIEYSRSAPTFGASFRLGSSETPDEVSLGLGLWKRLYFTFGWRWIGVLLGRTGSFRAISGWINTHRFSVSCMFSLAIGEIPWRAGESWGSILHTCVSESSYCIGVVRPKPYESGSVEYNFPGIRYADFRRIEHSSESGEAETAYGTARWRLRYRTILKTVFGWTVHSEDGFMFDFAWKRESEDDYSFGQWIREDGRSAQEILNDCLSAEEDKVHSLVCAQTRDDIYMAEAALEMP